MTPITFSIFYGHNDLECGVICDFQKLNDVVLDFLRRHPCPGYILPSEPKIVPSSVYRDPSGICHHKLCTGFSFQDTSPCTFCKKIVSSAQKHRKRNLNAAQSTPGPTTTNANLANNPQLLLGKLDTVTANWKRDRRKLNRLEKKKNHEISLNDTEGREMKALYQWCFASNNKATEKNLNEFLEKDSTGYYCLFYFTFPFVSNQYFFY